MTNINDFMKNFNLGAQISFGNTSGETVENTNVEEIASTNSTDNNVLASHVESNGELNNSQIPNQVVSTETQPENPTEEQTLANSNVATNTVEDTAVHSSTESNLTADVTNIQQDAPSLGDSSDDMLFAMINSNADGTNKKSKTQKSSSKPAQAKPKVPHYNAAQEYDVYWASRYLFTLPEELPEIPSNEIIPYIRKKIVEEFHYDQAKDSQYFEIVISDTLRANPATNVNMPCYVCQLSKGTTQRKG